MLLFRENLDILELLEQEGLLDPLDNPTLYVSFCHTFIYLYDRLIYHLVLGIHNHHKLKDQENLLDHNVYRQV